MNFAPLKNGVESIKHSADRYQAAVAKAWSDGAPALSPQALASLNTDLLKIQRSFLSERGLPERPWFKNQVYAPGAYTGYGAKPIAAVREYMDEKKWAEADAQVPNVGKVLEDAAAAIGKAADELESAATSGK
jgi:N-acetylated-alpha-linked acidic dipeptidase